MSAENKYDYILNSFLDKNFTGKTGVLLDDTNNQSSKYYIGEGDDSVVYKSLSSKHVLKFYSQERYRSERVPKEKLFLYRDITNKLSANATLKLDGLTLTVNPISAIIFCQRYNCHVGISRYISGPTLSMPDIMFPLTGNRFEKFESLSRNLNSDLSLVGIKILPCNVKWHKSSLVITDLCGSVKNLEQI